jgi:hypothetical protein
MIAKNLPVMQLVKFRRLSERSRLTFTNNLKIPKKPKADSGGGNYWVRSVSGISNAFKNKDNKFIQEKIDAVTSVYDSAKSDGTIMMYKRNLEILHSYTDFDFSTWCPSGDLQFLANPQLTLIVNDLPIQIIPNHVFSYDDKGEQKVGGIWFVCWLDGFKPDDLGIFSEALFRYLSFLHAKQYKVAPDYCSIVDVLTMERLSYQQVLEGKITPLLEHTINILNKYL